MFESRTLLVIASLLLVAVIARRWTPGWRSISAIPRWLLPVVAAVCTSLTVTWVWGGWNAEPVVDDEAAYLMQAQLFAQGHWRAPPPPEPVAFVETAVLFTPVLAPKMPPGHALLLAPGVLIGKPGLVPILLSGLSAALLMLLVRKLAGGGVAALTLVIWLTQGTQMRWRASYFSEITTGALWLLGWWALWRWRDTRNARWLLLLAAATGWGAITRPLTMLAFAIPVGVVVVRDVLADRRLLPQFAAAIGTGVVILLILPLQNREILGSWRRSPLQLYTRQYMPFDRMGFGYDSTPPLYELPPTLQAAQDVFIARHREHHPGALPRILLTRLRVLWAVDFLSWRSVLLPGAVIGVFLLGAEGWFAVVSALLLYLAYLAYAHEPHWNIYYLEATPVFAFLCAVGLSWIMKSLARARHFDPFLAIATSAVLCCAGWRDISNARVFRHTAQRPVRDLRADLRSVRHPAIVFLRYSGTHDVNVTLVRNPPGFASTPVLVAYDRGYVADQLVLAAYPGRAGYLWDEASREVSPLPRTP